jgi:N-acetyltransferase 10
MGLAVASAIAYGYSNIFVTSPNPENLSTLFEFLFKGFDLLGYKEHRDYEAVQSTNPELNKAIVRVNVYHDHRQTVQYIQPQDSELLSQAELVVIDEAAAIPLPLVKKLIGPYLVFMASTINGYEGTGRSLSLKLVQQLREKDRHAHAQPQPDGSSARVLREIALETPIRYSAGDKTEEWLHRLLCLDATNSVAPVTTCPHPEQCELYFVERDTLFSYHAASEKFLQQMMALYVASHYKNSPNDLQLMSDAPAHQLFVLLGPVKAGSSSLPDILCVVQVCLEGEISRQSILHSLSRGKTAAGDLIPWTMSQQFQDTEFGALSGARIVRIATHPDLNRMGYASRAIALLTQYYQGLIAGLDDTDAAAPARSAERGGAAAGSSLLDEKIEPRKNLPPLLQATPTVQHPTSTCHPTHDARERSVRSVRRVATGLVLVQALQERAPERLHYLGVSYGLSLQLLSFWKKAGFLPVYLRQATRVQLSVACRCAPGAWLPLHEPCPRLRALRALPMRVRDRPHASVNGGGEWS